jgi:hypothetical protein
VERFGLAVFGGADDLPERIANYVAAYEELGRDGRLAEPRRNALDARAFTP